ncbi:MAG: HlyC/CorC family transporter [Prolixibacteraceae bacterium]|nr:HlyC/CorC family transporter [Prolixibacteraceae bacterium]
MNEGIIIIVTIIFSAFFSGMEIAFVSANKMSLEMDKQQGNLTAGILNIFTSNPSQYIATMLVGNNISLVIYGLAFARLLEPSIQLYVHNDILVLLFQTIISTLIILVTAEFLPKMLFRLNANGFLKTLSLPVLFFYVILYPVAHFSMWLSKGIIKGIFKKNVNPETENNVFSRIDLYHYVKQPDKSGKIKMNEEETEVKLFKNALDFSKVKIRDCMVPRTEIEAVDEESEIEELRNRFIETGFSKILIFHDSIDNIIGYVHSSQIFKNPQSIKSITNPISIVPETLSASKLLGLFTQNHKSVAVVVDEFGGTSGLITTEDILEEIFGEIEDEHDTDDLILKKINNNEFIVSARYEIEALNEKLGFSLPDQDDYDTLAGLILNFHEDIPKTNSIISIDNFEFRILKASETRIELVLIKILSPE